MRGAVDKPKTGRAAGPDRDEPGQRRADPDVRRGLRADGVRDRRDHGGPGARPARLRLRQVAFDLADPPGGRAGETDDAPPRTTAFVSHTEHERLINSGQFSGMNAVDGQQAIVDWLDREGKGHSSVSYRLRDWLVSRQRYWGCPIPIVYCDGAAWCRCPRDDLPVELPDIEDYQPKGRSPLAAAEDWVNTTCPRCDGPGTARDRHDGHVRRLELVLPALLRPAQRHGGVGPRGAATAGCRSTSTSAASSTRSCT